MSFTIRAVTPDDAPALQVYAERLFAEGLPGVFRREPPTLEQETEFIGGYLDSPNSIALIAEENGEILGLIACAGEKHPEEAHVGEIGVSVACGHRGEGIGSALITSVLEWAPSHGIRRVQLHAFATNPGALRLYERLGFEQEGILRAAVMRDGEPIDVYVLARILPPLPQGGPSRA